jgi:NAD(P)-dependent dehydrogenase (short-subunit alcohol dehydrogenase family)
MKKIFLTGASSGIGLAIAQRLCAEGHEVWGTSRDPQRVPVLPRLHAVALDLADTNLVRQSFQAALAEAGHFDVVINNAGSGHFDAAASISGKVLAQQFQILVLAQIELCQLALAAMQKRGSGLIVNVSSLASRLPVPFMSAYNAAKAAMASFTMTLQLELNGSTIRVIDLQPADIRTPFNDSVLKSNTDDPAVAQIWAVVERNMKAAPPPELVARRVSALIEQVNPPPRVTVGDSFQAIVAPLIFKLLPQRVRLWGLKKYYRL